MQGFPNTTEESSSVPPTSFFMRFKAEATKNGLLIINADDWGGWKSATNAAMACFRKRRITSVSAMVFMEDSERAAALAKDSGIDVGLHVNLSQTFSDKNCPSLLLANQERTRRFLKCNKYALLWYQPFLRKHFHYVYQTQIDEFYRLYGKEPSHIDGHQHMHLCSNLVFGDIIPAGLKVRRSFSFSAGEKGNLNRAYRTLVDRYLTRKYITTDYMFALSQCMGNRIARVKELAKTSTLELITHPEKAPEYQWLMSDFFVESLGDFRTGTFTMLAASSNRANNT